MQVGRDHGIDAGRVEHHARRHGVDKHLLALDVGVILGHSRGNLVLEHHAMALRVAFGDIDQVATRAAASNVKGVAPEKLRRHAPTKTEGLMSQKLAEMKKNAQKMSTVQKSQLDWKGFVDKEGLRDELDEYGKSKKGFLAREAFLDRAAGAREQAARDARSRL